MNFNYGLDTKYENKIEMKVMGNSQTKEVLKPIVTTINGKLNNFIIDDYVQKPPVIDGSTPKPLWAYSVIYLNTNRDGRACTLNLDLNPNLKIEALKTQIASAIGKDRANLNFYRCKPTQSEKFCIYSQQSFTAYSYDFRPFPNHGLVRDLNLDTNKTMLFAIKEIL